MSKQKEVRIDVYLFSARDRRKKNDPDDPPLKQIKDWEFSFENSEEMIGTSGFSNFFRRYIQSFDGAFFTHERTGKSISINSADISFSSSQFVVDGTFKGGNSGIPKSVFSRYNSNEVLYSMKDVDVDSIDYYFLIQFDPEWEYLVLIVQSFNEVSNTSQLSIHMSHFLSKSLGSMVISNERYIPKAAVESIYQGSVIEEVTIRRKRYPSDKADALLSQGMFEKDLQFEVRLKGKGVRAATDNIIRKMRGGVEGFFTTQVIGDLGFDPQTSTVDVKYKNENNRTATAKGSDNFKIRPHYLLPFGVFDVDSETKLPTIKSLREHCKDLLEEVRDEILGSLNQ
jgi:hypothetical protein